MTKIIPISVTGAKLDPATGKIAITAGGVGEQNFEVTFVEDGKTIPLKFEGVVVPRPNAATISADKMNVVYRVVNPMSISCYF
jgi:hypothetical protein